MGVSELRMMITKIEITQLRELLDWPVNYHTVLPSTNGFLMNFAREGGQGPQVCLAGQQTAGRGRQAKSWHSPTGGNIYVSVLWPLKRPANGLSLAVGIAVALAIAELGVEIQLKWPNDLLFEQRKLGGILVELLDRQAIIGIGLNVVLPDAETADQPWIDLQHCLPTLPPYFVLVKTLLYHLKRVLLRFEQGGLGALADEWQRFECVQGKSVRLLRGAEITHGVVRGIDDDGALLLETTSQLQRFVAGEVSLRW